MNGAAGVESHQCALARACGVDYDREWRSGRTAHVEIAGIQSFSSGVTLYALWPHMHFRGKDMTFTLRYRRQEVRRACPKCRRGLRAPTRCSCRLSRSHSMAPDLRFGGFDPLR